MFRTILAGMLLMAGSAAFAQTTYYVPNGAVPSYSPYGQTYRPGGLPTGIIPGANPYTNVGSIATAPPGTVLPGQNYLTTSPSDPFGLGNNTSRNFQTATPPGLQDQERQKEQASPNAPQVVPPQTVANLPARAADRVDPRGQVLTGTATVINGDTISIGERLVTLFGADAPEKNQVCSAGGTGWRCGEKAEQRLTSLVDGRPIRCVGEIQAGDAISSVCSTVDGVDPAMVMVTEGLAVVPKAVSTRYVAMESEARLGRRGVWVGSFELPWDFRRKALGRKPTDVR